MPGTTEVNQYSPVEKCNLSRMQKRHLPLLSAENGFMELGFVTCPTSPAFHGRACCGDIFQLKFCSAGCLLPVFSHSLSISSPKNSWQEWKRPGYSQ